MLLRDILYGVEIQSLTGTTDKVVDELVFDSRKAVKGTAFIAIVGTVADGHNFIPQAVAAGAEVVLCTTTPAAVAPHVTYVTVKDTSYALGLMAANFYSNHPASRSQRGLAPVVPALQR
ncbi:MAG: hypothetical protein EOP51_23775 [Sphingobacteriales bacterium]|nr:MAG: hypothetical protein EOP51_23775 [Sphingobacteriales bacterium]